jgi:hypothetical protein
MRRNGRANGHNGCHAHVPAVDDCLFEVRRQAVPGVNPTAKDIGIAKRMVAIHQDEQWPSGRFCRNCHARYPCRWHRWGLNVLFTAGWNETDIAALLSRVAAGDVPWPVS